MIAAFSCLSRYLIACAIAFKFAQASLIAICSGEFPSALTYLHNFVVIWRQVTPR